MTINEILYESWKSTKLGKSKILNLLTQDMDEGVFVTLPEGVTIETDVPAWR